MKYIGAVILVLCCYMLGAERARPVRQSAVFASLLSKALAEMASLVELRGASVLQASAELASRRQYRQLAFFSAACGRARSGDDLARALAEESVPLLEKQLPGCRPMVTAAFLGLGRTSAKEEAAALKDLSSRLFSAAQELESEAERRAKLMKSVYSLAGAALAVMIM